MFLELVMLFSNNCLLSNAFSGRVLMSAPRGHEELNCYIFHCASSAKGVLLAPFPLLVRGGSQSVWLALLFRFWNHLPFPLCGEMHTCKSCHNCWLDLRICYFKPSHLVMYCSPSRMYSADTVSARRKTVSWAIALLQNQTCFAQAVLSVKIMRLKESWLIRISYLICRDVSQLMVSLWGEKNAKRISQNYSTS